MNLKELLKIDTTKTNWYKVFDKHGINPKTIDAVSKGGGGGDNITTIQQFLNKYKNLHVVCEIASGSGNISRWYQDVSRHKILNMNGMFILVVECANEDHGNPIVFDNNVYEERQKYSSVLNSIETLPIGDGIYLGIFDVNMGNAFVNGIFNSMFITYVENLDLI